MAAAEKQEEEEKGGRGWWPRNEFIKYFIRPEEKVEARCADVGGDESEGKRNEWSERAGGRASERADAQKDTLFYDSPPRNNPLTP